MEFIEQIRDISCVDLTEDDLLVVCKVLWDIFPEEEKEALKPILVDNLGKHGDSLLPENLVEALIEHLEEFRLEIRYERSQSVSSGDAYARFTFLAMKLHHPGNDLLPLLQEAMKQGNVEAAKTFYLLAARDPHIEGFGLLKVGKEMEAFLEEKDAIDILAMMQGKALGDDAHDFLVKKGAELGNPYCCWQYAMKCQEDGDYENAARYFEIGKFADNPEAMMDYALTYWIKGYGREDYDKAEELMRRAAYAGSVEAMAHLGKSLLWGTIYRKGKEIDIPKAYFYLKMAEELGHSSAAYYVGAIHDGFYEGTPEELLDKSLAIQTWERIAAKGYPAALMQLGCAYYNGNHGYRKNRELAWMYFREASKGGDALGGAYYADMIASREAPGTKELALGLFVRGMAAYCDFDADMSKQGLAYSYIDGGLFPKDPEWGNYILSFEVEYQGSLEKTRRWIAERLVPAREEYVLLHPDRDDEVDWREALIEVIDKRLDTPAYDGC